MGANFVAKKQFCFRNKIDVINDVTKSLDPTLFCFQKQIFCFFSYVFWLRSGVLLFCFEKVRFVSFSNFCFTARYRESKKDIRP